METTKILGLVLVLLGVSLILLGLYYSYNIFTGRTETPIIIKSLTAEIKTLSAAPSQPAASQPTEKIIQEQMSKSIEELLKNILPIDVTYKFFNLSLWSMFMAILFWGSSQIAGIGVKLMKS